MSSDWRWTTVEAVAAPRPAALATGPFGSSISAKYFAESGVPVIRGANLSADVGVRLSDEGLVFVSEEKAAEFRRSVAERGDLVFTCWGTINQVGLIHGSSKYARYIVSNKQMKLSVDPMKADSLFLYYLFSGPDKQAEILDNGIGSSVPGFNLGQLKKHEILLPPIATQKQITATLGALDDRIALLRETNATLEAIAQALFKSWFVNFDPVHAKQQGLAPAGLDEATAALFPDCFEESALGPVPSGWRTGPILDMAALLSGGTPKTDRQEFWGGQIPWASAKDVSQSSESVLVTTERTITHVGLERSPTRMIPRLATVVVARGATTGRMVLLGREMAMNQTCYALTSRVNAPIALYCQLRHAIDALVNAAHGSVFDTITTSTFHRSNVIQPPPNLLARFEEIASPIFERMVEATICSQALSTLRDTLLPRLISGQLRLPEAEPPSALA